MRSESVRGSRCIRTLLMISALLLALLHAQHATAIPTIDRAASGSWTLPIRLVIPPQPAPAVSGIARRRAATTTSNSPVSSSLAKRDTPVGMPQSCRNDFDCLQSSRPSHWPSEHSTVQLGNYACVFGSGSGNGTTVGSGTGTCQFVVTAGKDDGFCRPDLCILPFSPFCHQYF